MAHIPAKVEQCDVLLSGFSFHSVNNSPFAIYLVPCFSHFVLHVSDLAVQIGAQAQHCIAFSIPKQKKAVMCPVETIHGLDGFCSGMNYSAVAQEFKVN